MANHAVDVRRRQFFRGRVNDKGMAIRPPWSLPEIEFIRACDRCGACITACEAAILRSGDGGFPEVDFRAGACTFCAACLDACRPGALRGDSGESASPWSLSVQINDACLSMRGITCRSCGDRCPKGAIRFRLQTGGRAIPELSTAACDQCGACLSACPADAVLIRNTTQEVAA